MKRHTPTPCPWCGNRIDSMSAINSGDNRPVTSRPGDWSLCIECAKPLVYEQGGLRVPSTSELHKMSVHKDFVLASGIITIGGLLYQRMKVDDA